jgi:hypothetical protein
MKHVPRGAGLTKARKDMLERVFVRFSPHICHGIDSERHIETRFVRLASRGFDARTGATPVRTTCVTALALS